MKTIVGVRLKKIGKVYYFDPGKEKSVCYVDGETEEWSTEDLIFENEDAKLSVKQDEKYLYLYVNKKKKTDTLYIPFDITSKSGTDKYELANLQFDRDVDFLLVLNGREGEILVQEYYNVLKAINGYEISNRNSYINPPKKDSLLFEEIKLLIEPYGTNIFSHNYKQAVLRNTGKLTYGNANPSAKTYHSQADFYEKDNQLEIRIPWQILNFSNPSNNQIHDDYYYKYYGVKNMKIDKMYLGVGTGNEKISMKKLPLKGWKRNATYHERLKKSYYIVQKLWKERDE